MPGLCRGIDFHVGTWITARPAAVRPSPVLTTCTKILNYETLSTRKSTVHVGLEYSTFDIVFSSVYDFGAFVIGEVFFFMQFFDSLDETEYVIAEGRCAIG